ncbi:MAG: hypothetical protein Q9216_006741 [Gyalolechia sp. 2 TL-2023]
MKQESIAEPPPIPPIPDIPFDAAVVLVDVAMPAILAMVGDMAMVEVPDIMSMDSMVQSTVFVYFENDKVWTQEEWIVVSSKVYED